METQLVWQVREQTSQVQPSPFLKTKLNLSESKTIIESPSGLSQGSWTQS